MARRIWEDVAGGGCVWKTDSLIECSICGKHTYRVFEICEQPNVDPRSACWDFEDQSAKCFRQLWDESWADSPDSEFLYSRVIETAEWALKKKRKREPVGLSLRYHVLKRDGFQCVLCGNSGRDARLEIDHIVPVAAGGNSTKDNLQTLCFDCNRGKGAKHDDS